MRKIAALPDPVGEVVDGSTLPNGLQLRRVRVPLGVIAVVYEARPNVTIDAAALCLKSGNAVVLRGSSSALHSNAVLAGVAAQAATEAGLPAGAMSLLAGGDREELAELATQTGVVDLIIPRGGEGLKAALKGVATVPVIFAASGNNHVFVDASADLDDALAIVLNAKLQRPGTCNAAEKLLVHADVADRFLPRRAAGAERRRRPAARRRRRPRGGARGRDRRGHRRGLGHRVPGAGDGGRRGRRPPEDAIAHVNAHGSGHSEAIVTQSTASARAFQLGVDAACVYVNASTRFTDGGEFGMGAEIGNSTQKLHARGPIGLRELCTFKYLVEGAGHTRA